MPDDQWAGLISSGTFNQCRCGHFSLKHNLDSGACYALDENVRCPCRQLDLRPNLRSVE